MKVTSNQQDFYQIKRENRKDATVPAVILTLPPHFFFFFSFFHFLLPSHFQRRGRFLLFILPLPISFFVFFYLSSWDHIVICALWGILPSWLWLHYTVCLFEVGWWWWGGWVGQQRWFTNLLIFLPGDQLQYKLGGGAGGRWGGGHLISAKPTVAFICPGSSLLSMFSLCSALLLRPILCKHCSNCSRWMSLNATHWCLGWEICMCDSVAEMYWFLWTFPLYRV